MRIRPRTAGATRRPLHVNGKWLSQNLSGTQRYAAEIVAQCVELGTDLVVHIPAGVTPPEWMGGSHVRVVRSRFSGVVFEQVALPLSSRGAVLLNFAGPAPLFKLRQLVTMHDATPFRYPRTFRPAFVAFYALLYAVLSRTATHVITVSAFSAGELSRLLRVPRERFVVAGCAAGSVTTAAPERPPLADRVEDIGACYLVVGNLAIHKNLREPVAALVGSGRPVIVVGAAGDPRVFGAASPLASAAIIAGRLTDGELRWMYENCRALVFPSHYEGFGLPLVEAQSLRCPVVSSRSGSLPEVGADAALYFDADDTTELLCVVTRLENDDQLRSDLIERGVTNAARHSWRVSAETVLATLRCPVGRSS
ncbi:glycosyltransferase family 4 protein [Gordonia sp. NPDC003376]